MALFNKLFPSRKNTNKYQDNVSEKLFAFSKDQVRIVLFRECDFRGRKLLFDSSAVKKVSLGASTGEAKEGEQNEKFAEVSDGHGFLYTKPQADFSHLAEMVFGSVAMSFRGTYFKIHNLSSPQRLMFTQVFPSPRHSGKSRISSRSYPRTSSQSLEHSIKLDDSSASSTTSISEQLSVHSTASDTILVCRRLHSSPLDVPSSYTRSNPSMVGDSGLGDQSYYSISSGPPSIPNWEAVFPHNGFSTFSLSSGSLYKRWLRSTSTSLDHSGTSLTGSVSGEECFLKPHQRSSKLGLGFIIELTAGQEENLVEFFMEHITLLESMLWRARKAVEMAYSRPSIFVSQMVNVSECSAQWLVSLLSGPFIAANLWQLLSNGCDNHNSISAFNACVSDKNSCLDGAKNSFLTNSFNAADKSSEFTFFNISKFLRSEWDTLNSKKVQEPGDRTLKPEKFVREFCEILESIDIKDTNFFVSTLLTAVLTHHLGWVGTCLPCSNAIDHTYKHPYNSLWDQLSDLYGAVGHPTKMAQTIVTGTDRNELITKLLNSLTYFIRCSNVERKLISRQNVSKENEEASDICKENLCIPKENYKKYEDHLKEILSNPLRINSRSPVAEKSVENIELNEIPKRNEQLTQETKVLESVKKPTLMKKGLSKTHTCLSNLAGLVASEEQPFSEEVENNNNNEKSTESLNKLCRIRKCTSIVDFSKKIDMETQKCSSETVKNLDLTSLIEETTKDCNNPSDIVDDSDNQVIFVLGDSDKLVDLTTKTGTCKKINVKPSKSADFTNKTPAKRPTFLDLRTNKTYESFRELEVSDSYTGEFKDADFLACKDNGVIKPSTSLTSLDLLGKEDVTTVAKKVPIETENEAACSNVPKPSRSQSVPPEERDGQKNPGQDKTKSKFRYTGVKFNLQQYPQIVTNYMKSKNLELTNLPIKAMKFDEISALPSSLRLDFAEYESDSEEVEALQTPSNASELEFTSDLTQDFPKPKYSRESADSPKTSLYKKTGSSVRKELEGEKGSSRKSSIDELKMYKKGNWCSTAKKMSVVNLPMPKSVYETETKTSIPYTSTIMKGLLENYVPDMVLQGIAQIKNNWDYKLKSDLSLTSQHSLLDQPVEEAVAIIANTDTWQVEIMSSHTYIIDKGTTGIRVGMSQLVANMLESLLNMWKLQAPPQHCLMHIEQRLQELCLRSKALAQLLLATEFCSMELLTSTLHLEVNDVPLLMAVASTHSPQVTQKYGLSFQ